MPISDVIEEGPFGSVGARDGADAVYRDVLAAVPNGPSSSAALIGLRDSAESPPTSGVSVVSVRRHAKQRVA